METVYIETTVVGHLVGRTHANPTIAYRQTISRDWWKTAVSGYRIFVSRLVIEECASGDPNAANERLNFLKTLEQLDSTPEVDALAMALINAGAVPASEPRDAFHIAIATVNGIQYLVTWNFRHIANATLREKIETTCRLSGYEPPIICTPDELAGVDDGT